MEIQFTKMHGIGNDFMVIDAVTQRVSLDAEQIRHLADRHFGVGFDQLLLVEKASHAEADFRYRIFNADGGEVSQCGNGARCFVRFVVDKGLTQKREITVETASGLLTLTLQDNGQVTVNMGAPRFMPAEIPFIAAAEAINYTLEVSGVEVEIGAVSMGNPHAVQVVADVELAPVTTQGALIEAHARFPDRVNAGYMQIISPRLIKLRVFERGSGETLACGSGACAAVVVGIRRGLLLSPVSVEMRGGVIEIRWDGIGQPVWMTGPAECVFDGKIELKTREQ